MKVATYNVNSIRKRLPIILDWLTNHQPDVLCLQETKVQDSDFPAAPIQEAGYHATFRGMKGFNGVATLSRKTPDRIMHGFESGSDSESVRLLTTVIEGIPIINTYVPQGNSITSEKYAFKLQWLGRLRRYFENSLDPAAPAIWLGDLNVAPEPIDVYHPDRRANDVDFHIDARMAFQEAAAWGFLDLFRYMHPGRVQYTYWDYFRRAYENNWGWRIDHIMVTQPLAVRCQHTDVDLAPREAKDPSDHTVLWAEFDL